MILISYYQKSLSITKNDNDVIILPLTLANVLQKANTHLEKDLNHWVKAIGNHPYSHLTWASTWYNLRLDDLEGVILYYYILEIIRHLGSNTNNSFIVKGELPAFVAKAISAQLNQTIRIKWQLTSTLKNNFIHFLSPFRLVLDYWSKKQISLKESDLMINKYWFSAPIDIKRHRYRYILDFFDPKNRIFFHANHTLDIKTEKQGISMNFIHWSKWKDFLKAASASRRITSMVKNQTDNSILASCIKNISFTNYAGMYLREIWVDRAIKALKPRAIFFTTANTYSPARLMSRLAKLNNIPFIVVACRSMFTNLRLEERISQVDLDEIHDARVADFYILWDQFSINTLFEQRIPKSKLFLAQKNNKNTNYELHLTDKFILLLSHEESLNDKIINSWLQAAANLNIIQLVIRTHPLCKLSEKQKNLLNSFEIIDCSAIAMNLIRFEDCVVLTINSTAAVEAVSYGAGVIWIPYLNFRSVIFWPVMKVLGIVSQSHEELQEYLNFLVNTVHKRQLAEKCSIAYEEYFTGEEDVENLFNKLSIA